MPPPQQRLFMLRYSCSVLVHIGAVVLGPHFASAGACDEEGAASAYGCPGPYIMACIYGVICMLLLNVQVRVAAAHIGAASRWCCAMRRSCAAAGKRIMRAARTRPAPAQHARRRPERARLVWPPACVLALPQASAEMPFDETGLDDVFLELASEFSE